jgi:hypothetical protein
VQVSVISDKNNECSVLLRIGNVLDKSCREYQNTYFIVTVSGYVILIAFLLQQYLHERASTLCCMHITHLVFILWETKLHLGKVYKSTEKLSVVYVL